MPRRKLGPTEREVCWGLWGSVAVGLYRNAPTGRLGRKTGGVLESDECTGSECTVCPVSASWRDDMRTNVRDAQSNIPYSECFPRAEAVNVELPLHSYCSPLILPRFPSPLWSLSLDIEAGIAGPHPLGRRRASGPCSRANVVVSSQYESIVHTVQTYTMAVVSVSRWSLHVTSIGPGSTGHGDSPKWYCKYCRK